MKRIFQDLKVNNYTTPEGLPNGGYYSVRVPGKESMEHQPVLEIQWQRGPLIDPATGEERTPNGLFLETAVRACIERLAYYQTTPFKSRENEVALIHLETALLWLGKRAERRLAEGSLGTHLPDRS